MNEIVKHINDTNASYRTPEAGDAKNTDLFLDNEHYELFKDAGEQITVRFSKENLSKAILFIVSILPRKYDNSGMHKSIAYSSEFVYDQLAFLDYFFKESGVSVDKKTQRWNVRKNVPKKNGEIDYRFYFNGLLDDVEYVNVKNERVSSKFTIRNYLAGGYSDLHIKRANDGIFDVWVTNVQQPYFDDKEEGLEIEDKWSSKNTPLHTISNGIPSEVLSKYAQYLTALRTKPFLLLAGISGTGKSRIVRELARSCYEVGSEEYSAHKPKNFEMIQVKPNWHDSTELLGYVSRISGTPEFVAGDFLRFIVKAWENLDTPHFLCLDEMNLAPVEQYFAEYLSVVESRKFEDGKIVTDPIIKPVDAEWYKKLVRELTKVESIQEDFVKDGISLPPNLFVVGTVNMDETTYSFSRKVLDRAMTIEMNEVDLNGGLQKNVSELGHIDPICFKPVFVEGCDVYDGHKELCDEVIDYLTEVNNILEGTPFKIAYRTRNEFLVYAVNRQLLAGEGSNTLNSALDEMTSMKILSRIEGDAAKTETVLKGLDKLFKDKGFDEKGISLSKIKEMQDKLMATDYCSFWS